MQPALLQLPRLLAGLSLLLVVVAAACGAERASSVSGSSVAVPAHALPLPQQIAPDSSPGRPTLPLTIAARQSSSAAQLPVDLSMYTAIHSGSVLGDKLGLAAGSDSLAYAVYAIPSPVAAVENVAMTGSDGLWLLLADFGSGRWSEPVRCAGDFAIAGFDAIQQPLNAQGFVLCAVVAPPGTQGQLESLLLNYDGPAHVLYVASPASGGNDGNDGSYYHPLATTQHAADLLQPDTTVFVRQGEYHGFEIPTGGLEGQPVAFIAEPGARLSPAPGGQDFGIAMVDQPVNHLLIEGFDIDSFAVEAVGLGLFSQNCSDVTLRNLNCHGSTQGGISAIGISGLLLEDCQVSGIDPGLGISITSCPGVAIRGCTVTAPYGHGISVWNSSGALIENCTVDGTVSGYGIWYFGTGSDVVLRGNRVSSPAFDGIRLEYDFAVSSDSGLHDFLIVGNRVDCSTGSSGPGIHLIGLQGGAIRNNLVYGFNSGGIACPDAAEHPSSGLSLVHNTVVQYNDGGGPDSSTIALNLGAGAGSFELHNNIFVAPISAVKVDPQALTSLGSNNNLFSGGLQVNMTSYDLAAWNSTFGFDGDSAAALPLGIFLDLSGADFHLHAGSPALNLADPLWSPAGDIDGALRNQDGEPDCGCFEFFHQQEPG